MIVACVPQEELPEFSVIGPLILFPLCVKFAVAMMTGELADVKVNVQLPLMAAELGYWQPGITHVTSAIRV